MIDLTLRHRKAVNVRSGARDAARATITCVAAWLFITGGVARATVIYVDVDAVGANNGTTWGDAVTDLQLALNRATSGDEIWVAEGTYTPSLPLEEGEPRSATFLLATGVAIFGGFTGREDQRGQRDPDANPTVLSGDRDGDDGGPLDLTALLEDPASVDADGRYDDNCFHVVTAQRTDDTAVLDGFTILAGVADGRYVDRRIDGGGLLIVDAGPTLRDCAFRGNGAVRRGGAIFSYSGNPTLLNCTFVRNMARQYGGGMSVWSGNPILTGCTFEENTAWAGGGMEFLWGSRPSLTRCTFIGNSAMLGSGGGVYNQGGNPTFSDCSFQKNSAIAGGGGVSSWNADLEFTHCVFDHNVATADDGEGGGLAVSVGTATLTNCAWRGNAAARGAEIAALRDAEVRLLGDGTVAPGLTGTVTVSGRLVIGDDLRVESGRFIVEPSGEFVIEDRAVVALGEGNNWIHARGALQARGEATVVRTTIDVFAPFGQFFVGNSASVTDNEIHADSDRYLDLDPRQFAGTVSGNRIFLSLAEGIGQDQGGFVELRALDLDCDDPACEPGLFRRASIPEFDQMVWPIERLELPAGVGVNLVNRFDFQKPFDSGGGLEVLYVKNLVLGRGSVLNMAFHRLYFENLVDGNGNALALTEDGVLANGARIVNEPLLGFSLRNIAFDSVDEFGARIRSLHDVYRVTNVLPDRGGMMRMCNRIDVDSGLVLHARAQGVFGLIGDNEDEILIAFHYLYETPGGELVVYLSESADLDDGDREEVARVPHPPVGEPGSEGSGRFGVFHRYVPRGDRRFSRGVRIELELEGPAGTCVLIDDFDPVTCTSTACGDTTGEGRVDAFDFFTVLTVFGTIVATIPPDTKRLCLDLLRDGYINLADIKAFHWTLAAPHLCPLDVPSEGNPAGQGVAAAGHVGSNGFTTASPGSLVAGVGYDPAARVLQDVILVINAEGQVVDETIAPCNESLGGHSTLVQDGAGEIYQSGPTGLIRLRDCKVVIPPGIVKSPDGVSDVFVGPVVDAPGIPLGMPILDAAFDPDEYVYILPVTVRDGAMTYKAVAKLRRVEAADPPYEVVRLYGGPPEEVDFGFQQLREVEIDPVNGRVFVSSTMAWNAQDRVRVYNAETGEVLQDKRLSRLATTDGANVDGPIGLYYSPHRSALYFAPSVNAPDATSTTIHRLSTQDLTLQQSIEIQGMGHVIAITEDPLTGTLWVVGFVMSDVPETPSSLPTAPCFAEIRQDGSDVVQAFPIQSAELGLPLSAVFVGPLRGDVDRDGDVDLADYLRFSACFTGSGRPVADECAAADADGDGDVDLSDFGAFQSVFTGTR